MPSRKLRKLISAAQSEINNLEEIERIKQQKFDEQYQRVEKELRLIEDFLRNPKIENLIAVRLTEQFPYDGIARPASKGLVMRLTLKTKIKGIIHDLRTTYPRYTLHFALNHAVAKHAGGDWSGRQFAILVPLKDVIGRIINLSPIDAWVLGDLQLPANAEIMMRKSLYSGLETGKTELKEKRKAYWEKHSGGISIITFDDNIPIHKAVGNRIKEKGYTLIYGNKDDWDLFTAFHYIIKNTQNLPF